MDSGLRELTVHTLAGVGLLLALSVMGAVFMATAAQGDTADSGDTDGYSLAAPPGSAPVAAEASRSGTSGPSPLGVALGVLVLGTGVTVLAWGARRPQRHWDVPDLPEVLPVD